MRKLKFAIWMALTFGVNGAAQAATQAECEAKLKEAQAAGIIYQIRMVDSTPTIVIDEQVFASLPFDAKQNIIDTLNCALFDDGRKLGEVVIVSNTSYKRLARWTLFKGLVVD
ncbi:hypothetical protein [Mesorhizobium sp.]|uniref:hypothetical protein n=1 Tax=Mesorhizobium sp. TaxID=1871066 RepID=UPI000FE73485|nr:hypothetical protein [Mesorhizobium sp.]RWD94517.1 MAG: hypothetical protein EOS39_07075 [Mesorhizobium sp.]TIV49105.1 MAG: hypothetical protein E5V88_26230 [Mesorhizobium sp.]